MEIDRGRAWFWLPSLARREVRVLGGRLEGAEIEVDPRPKDEAPRRRRAGPGWRVVLGELDAEGLRRVRVGDHELAAAGASTGALRGRASFQARGPMQLHLERLVFADAVVRSGGREVARRVRLDAGLDSRPHRIGAQGLADFLAGVDGSLELHAETDNLGFVAAYLRRVPWLRLDGAGDLAVDAELGEGALLPGSRLTFRGEDLRADFFDFTARGGGRLEGQVAEEGGGLRLAVALPRFDLHRARDGAALLAGRDLETRVTTTSAAVYEAPAGLAGRVSLPSARVADLSLLGSYLPPGLLLRLDGGRAELSAELDYDTVAGSGSGRLALDAREVAGAFGDAAFAGDLALHAESRSLDLVAGRFDVSGSRLEVAGGRFARGGKVRSTGWWARVEVPAGRVTLAPSGAEGTPTAMAIVADLDATMLDTAPLVVLLEQRLPRLAWFDRLLTVQDVGLSATLAARGPALGLYGVEATGGEGRLEIRADLDLDGPATSGAAYVRYRALDASLVLDDGRRDWGLVKARRQYDEAAASRREARRDR